MLMTRRCWSDADSGKLKYVLRERCIPVSLCPSKITRRLAWHRIQASEVTDWRRTATVITWPVTLQTLVQCGEKYLDLAGGSYQSTV